MARLPRLLAALALLVAVSALSAAPALARSRDHDRMPDRWERKHHLNVNKNDANRDFDRDGLSNYGEYRSRTNPRKRDSDHDGRRDGREDRDRDKLLNAVEIHVGYDPGDADSDDDGIKDGRENAGTITKLSISSVTLKLAVGGTLTAGLALDCTSRPPSGGDAPGAGGDGSEGPTDPSEDEESGDDPEDEGSGDAADDLDASIAQDPGDEDDEAFDDSAFDRQFESDFAAGETVCATSALKVGARVREATVRRTASGPMIVAIKLRR